MSSCRATNAKMKLHDMWYVVITDDGRPPVAYPEAEWDFEGSRPKTEQSEQCDCLETAVDYYRIYRKRLHSEGSSVLSDRDVRVLDAILDIWDGVPRKPRH